MTILAGLLLLIQACTTPAGEPAPEQADKGKLFIIGGGSRPPALMQDMIREAGIGTSDYILVFPMSSEIPDTVFMSVKEQFADAGFSRVYNFNYKPGDSLSPGRLDSIRNARLIYFPGGSQVRFMNAVAGSPLPGAFHAAYENGGLLAGTSAGAAIMSKKMITGDQYKHQDYTGDFSSIEADNIEIAPGLGLVDAAIIDQHFVKRMRLNRLISAVLENPGETGIGIDESTAICVNGDSARVYGEGQVIVLRHRSDSTRVWNGLLGGRDLEMDVLLPGEIFPIRTD